MAKLISAIYQTTQDRVIAFVVWTDGHLHDVYWNGQAWIWEDHKTPTVQASGTVVPVASVSAVYQTSQDRVIAFAIGTDGHLYDLYWNGDKWVWEDQGTPSGTTLNTALSPSAVYQTSQNRIIVFVVGNDGNLYDKYWNGQSWVWELQGGPPSLTPILVASSPSAIYQTSQNRIVAFVVGDDGNLYDVYWNGQAWQWENQGNPSGTTLNAIFSPSTVYQTTQDRIVAFVVGIDNNLYDRFWNGQAWQWESHGVPTANTPTWVQSSPSAVYRASLDQIIAFVAGNDGNLYFNFWDGQGWVWATPTPEQPSNLPQGGQGGDGPFFNSSPSATYQTSLARIIAFAIGNDGNVYDTFWDATASAGGWDNQGPPTG
jgi:hypothetical protein